MKSKQPYQCSRRACIRTSPSYFEGGLCDHHAGTPEPAMAVPRSAIASQLTLVILLLLAIALILLCGCGLPEDVVAGIEQDRKDWDVVANDPSYPAKAREIGQGASDWCWWTLYRTGEVDELPPDVRARIESKGR